MGLVALSLVKTSEGGKEMKTTFIYRGPVFSFGRIINNSFEAKTIAVRSKKALSNLAYTYKKQFGLISSAKVELNPKCLVEA